MNADPVISKDMFNSFLEVALELGRLPVTIGEANYLTFQGYMENGENRYRCWRDSFYVGNVAAAERVEDTPPACVFYFRCI